MSAIQSASAELAAVQAAVNQAVDGDTVLIPAGTATWQAGITTQKALQFIGRSIGATVLIEKLQQNGNLFRLVTQAGKPYRLTGIEFRDGRDGTDDFPGGTVNLSGDSHMVRLDHCKFDATKSPHVRFSDGWVLGVADNNHHVINRYGGVAYMLSTPGWGGDRWGDKSFSEPIDWGGPLAWYIESSKFERGPNAPAGNAKGLIDTYGGCRFVFRHNQTLNCNLPTHGTGDGAGRNRGLRSFEVYNNDLVYNPPSNENVFHVRGGTGVFCNNRMVGVGKGMTLHYYRYSFDTNPFGHANGLNAFDRNDPTLYLSGTCGAGSTNLKLVVPGAGWASNQWVGYSVWVPNSSQHPRGYISTIVIANTADTLAVDPSSRNQPKPFVEGEYFELRKILLGLDMPGAGTSDLLTDKTATPTPVNLNQQNDPIYSWGNIGAPDPVSNPECTEGVHFFRNTPRPGWKAYTYPHPLTAEQPTHKPLAPRNLRIV